MKIQFTVPGVPVAQPRVKATLRSGHAGVYTPTKNSAGHSNGIAEFKALVKMMAAKEYSGPPLEGPIRVDAEFVFPRQAAKVWSRKPMPRYRKTTKPDVDNLVKSLLDCLNQVMWVDDAQVSLGPIDKWHARGSEQAHVLVTIEQIPEEE